MKIIFLSSFWIDDTFSTEVTHPHTHPSHQHRREVHVKFVGEIFLKFVFFRRSPNRRRMNSNWVTLMFLGPTRTRSSFCYKWSCCSEGRRRETFSRFNLINNKVVKIPTSLINCTSSRLWWAQTHNLWAFMQLDYIKGSFSNLVTICRRNAISARRQNLHKRLSAQIHFPERREIHKIVNGCDEKDCCCHYSHKSYTTPHIIPATPNQGIVL